MARQSTTVSQTETRPVSSRLAPKTRSIPYMRNPAPSRARPASHQSAPASSTPEGRDVLRCDPIMVHRYAEKAAPARKNPGRHRWFSSLLENEITSFPPVPLPRQGDQGGQGADLGRP